MALERIPTKRNLGKMKVLCEAEDMQCFSAVARLRQLNICFLGAAIFIMFGNMYINDSG